MLLTKKGLPSMRDSVIYGWVSWLLAFATSMILHPGNTSPFNRPTAFLLFSGFYSVFYILDMLILVPLICVVLPRLWPASRPWQWAFVGGVLFSISVPLWGALILGSISFNMDTAFVGSLGAIAGAVSCYAFRRANSPSI